MARARFILTSIQCIETEDYSGADEFYVVGLYAVIPKDSNNPREVGTPKISGVWEINDGETETPNYDLLGRSVVFDEHNEVLRFDIKCMDKDISADLEGVDIDGLTEAADLVTEAGEKVAEAEEKIKTANENSPGAVQFAEVLSTLNPITAALRAAEWATDTLWRALRGSLGLDKDDFLGEDYYEFIPNGTPSGQERGFPCRFDGCRYWVKYKVDFL